MSRTPNGKRVKGWILPMCGLLLLAACKREAVELQGSTSEPAAAVRELAQHLQRNDLVAFTRSAVPPGYHAQLETAWQQGHSRWPLTELPLEDKLVPLLAALSAPGSERQLTTSFDRQFARQERDLKDATRALGQFGVQYVRHEGDYTAEERDHYVQLIGALSEWAAQAPLADPGLAHAAIPRLAAAARQVGLDTEEALQQAGMASSLQRLTPMLVEIKATLDSYGLPLDRTFANLRTGLVEQQGDRASVRIHYPLGDREIDTVVSLERRDGRWYLSDYLRHAEQAIEALKPDPGEVPPIDPDSLPGADTPPG
ncbi:hypothetical protein [Pseudoxanthomonas wuyuanensis]